MTTEKFAQVKKLFACIGEISDYFLEEANSADIVAYSASRKRVKQRVITAAASVGAASVGIAVTLLLLKAKRRQTAS